VPLLPAFPEDCTEPSVRIEFTDRVPDIAAGETDVGITYSWDVAPNGRSSNRPTTKGIFLDRRCRPRGTIIRSRRNTPESGLFGSSDGARKKWRPSRITRNEFTGADATRSDWCLLWLWVFPVTRVLSNGALRRTLMCHRPRHCFRQAFTDTSTRGCAPFAFCRSVRRQILQCIP